MQPLVKISNNSDMFITEKAKSKITLIEKKVVSKEVQEE